LRYLEEEEQSLKLLTDAKRCCTPVLHSPSSSFVFNNASQTKTVLLPYPEKITRPKNVCPKTLSNRNISCGHPQRFTVHRLRS